MGKKNNTKKDPMGTKQSAETAAVAIRPPPKPIAPTSHSAADLLSDALAGLDAIAAHGTQPVGSKRPRGVGVGVGVGVGGSSLSALALPHYDALRRLVAQYGPQLTPSLDAVVRRVLPMLAAAETSSAACWALAAALATQYAAGAARLVAGVLELLLAHGPAAFLLAHGPAAFLLAHGPAGDSDKDKDKGKGNSNNNNNNNNNNNGETAGGDPAAHRVEALDAMLLAAAAFVETDALQRAAMRFADEVVAQGMLDGARDVPRPLHAPCIALLATWLLACRPLPALVAASAARAVREMPARADGEVMRAVRRLAATLHAVRHPHAVPFYAPPQDIVERPTRRVVGADKDPTMASKESQTDAVKVEEAAAAAVPVQGGNHSATDVRAPTTGILPMKQSAGPPRRPLSAEGKVEVPAATPRQTPKLVPLPPVAPLAPHDDNDDIDEDALPDIDIED